MTGLSGGLTTAAAGTQTSCNIVVCATALAWADGQEINNAPDIYVMACGFAGSGGVQHTVSFVEGEGTLPGCNGGCNWEEKGSCSDGDIEMLTGTKCGPAVEQFTVAKTFIDAPGARTTPIDMASVGGADMGVPCVAIDRDILDPDEVQEDAVKTANDAYDKANEIGTDVTEYLNQLLEDQEPPDGPPESVEEILNSMLGEVGNVKTCVEEELDQTVQELERMLESVSHPGPPTSQMATCT